MSEHNTSLQIYKYRSNLVKYNGCSKQSVIYFQQKEHLLLIRKKKKEIFIEEVVVTFHTRAIKNQKPNIGIYDYRTINY